MTLPTSGRNNALAVVLDTNVLLSLYVFKDSRFAAIRHAVDAGRWRPLTDARCLGEFRRVLAYPLFQLDTAAQEAALAAYATGALVLDPRADEGIALPLCQDKDDQKFLELARDGNAALLVTSDKALLKLARRGRLRQLFRILPPDAALALLAGDDSAIVRAENGAGDANRHIR